MLEQRGCDHNGLDWSKPNTLVLYKGGGYDGCHWEWNAAVFDGGRAFQNLFASGHNGCETFAELRQYVLDLTERGERNGYYAYRIDCDECWKEFVDNHSKRVVVMVVQRMEAAGFPHVHDLQLNCSCCGKPTKASALVTTPAPAHYENLWVPDYDAFICGICYEEGYCNICDTFYMGEHYNAPHPHVEGLIPAVAQFNGQVCEYCHETLGDAIGIPQRDEWDDMVTQMQEGYAWMCGQSAPLSVRVERMRRKVAEDFSGLFSRVYAWQFVIGACKKLIEDGMDDSTWLCVTKEFHPKEAIREELGYVVTTEGNVFHWPTTAPQSRAAAFYDAQRAAHPAVVDAVSAGTMRPVSDILGAVPSFIRGEDDPTERPFAAAATLVAPSLHDEREE